MRSQLGIKAESIDRVEVEIMVDCPAAQRLIVAEQEGGFLINEAGGLQLIVKQTDGIDSLERDVYYFVTYPVLVWENNA